MKINPLFISLAAALSANTLVSVVALVTASNLSVKVEANKDETATKYESLWLDHYTFVARISQRVDALQNLFYKPLKESTPIGCGYDYLLVPGESCGMTPVSAQVASLAPMAIVPPPRPEPKRIEPKLEEAKRIEPKDEPKSESTRGCPAGTRSDWEGMTHRDVREMRNWLKPIALKWRHQRQHKRHLTPSEAQNCLALVDEIYGTRRR